MDEKEELLEHMRSILGHIPGNTNFLLKVLVHPDVIEHTKAYVRKMDVGSQCTQYAYPWSCIKEAEAHYENIKFGWLAGSGSGVGLNDSWCENCRRKVMEE